MFEDWRTDYQFIFRAPNKTHQKAAALFVVGAIFNRDSVVFGRD
jgi:hypothetical protein